MVAETQNRTFETQRRKDAKGKLKKGLIVILGSSRLRDSIFLFCLRPVTHDQLDSGAWARCPVNQTLRLCAFAFHLSFCSLFLVERTVSTRAASNEKTAPIPARPPTQSVVAANDSR